jgi:PKD repeat protein
LTSSPSNTGGTYIWSPNGETSNTLNVAPITTTSYSVVYSLNGCESSAASGTVTINPIPTVSFSADQLTGCAPLSVQLTNTGSLNGTYSWSLSNGQTLNGSSAEYTFLQGGCYDITLTTTENGCSNTSTIQDYICVESPPGR